MSETPAQALPPAEPVESAPPAVVLTETPADPPLAAVAPAVEPDADPLAEPVPRPAEDDADQRTAGVVESLHEGEGVEAGDNTAPADVAPAEPSGEAAPRAAPIPDLSPAACAALLAEHFPALFSAGRALPLKLRIQADIQQRAPGLFNKKSLSIFLHRYTTGNAYLKALAQAPHRFDLDGAPSGEVNDEHRSAAVAELERRKAIFEDRRHAEREMQREAAVAARRAQAAQQAARHAAHDAAEADARRERAAVLRAFEATTLTSANFCALKGLVEADLPALLERARLERTQRAAEPQPAHAPQRPQRPRQGQEPRREGGRPPRSGPREGRPESGAPGGRPPHKAPPKPQR
jgi:sRNA-binding protein